MGRAPGLQCWPMFQRRRYATCGFDGGRQRYRHRYSGSVIGIGLNTECSADLGAVRVRSVAQIVPRLALATKATDQAARHAAGTDRCVVLIMNEMIGYLLSWIKSL